MPTPDYPYSIFKDICTQLIINAIYAKIPNVTVTVNNKFKALPLSFQSNINFMIMLCGSPRAVTL